METKALEKKIDKAFNAPVDQFFSFSKTLSVPSINVTESDNTYGLSVATPGLDKKDINIEVTDGILTISAEKESEEKQEKKNGRYNRMEYNYSSWSRSIRLPKECYSENIKAEYKNGELKLSIPKTGDKKSSNAKKIDIS